MMPSMNRDDTKQPIDEEETARLRDLPRVPEGL